MPCHRKRGTVFVWTAANIPLKCRHCRSCRSRCSSIKRTRVHVFPYVAVDRASRNSVEDASQEDGTQKIAVVKMPTNRSQIQMVNVDPWETTTLSDCRKFARDIIRRQEVGGLTLCDGLPFNLFASLGKQGKRSGVKA